MPAARPSFFDGVPADELAQILSGLERRRFPAGATVVAEGDSLGEIYVVQSGSAEVLVTDRQGAEHRVGRIRTGSTLGEMSLFTGQPAIGTVRAIEDIDLLVLTEDDFESIATRFPHVYRNVGAILSERLARTDRLAVKEAPGRLGLLHDWGAPPLLSYALACSVAWHTRASTLLLVLGNSPPDELRQLAFRIGDVAPAHARVVLSPTLEHLRQVSVAGRVDELFTSHENILVRVPQGEPPPPLVTARTLHLADSRQSVPADAEGTIVLGWADNPEPPRLDRDGTVVIPRLDAGDEEALGRGELPATSAAGRALGLAARDFAELKVGLALGSGSLRGYAHVGVLEVLKRAGLTFDYLAGTSVGGIVAALHAMGFDAAGTTETLDHSARTLVRATLSRKSLVSHRGIKRYIQEQCRSCSIEGLELPLGLVAADIETQREVVIRRGPVWLGVLATMSIPGVYPALRVGPHLLVDGAVLNPVPVSVAADMGADVVIGVKLGSPAQRPADDVEAVESDGPRPSAVAVMMRSFEIMQNRITPDAPGVTTITITPELPDLPGSKLRNFMQGRRYIENGAEAAADALPRIEAALPWLRADGGA